MSNCTYKLDRVNKTFNNEFELNDYLIKNRLNNYTANSYVFELSSKSQEIFNKISNLQHKGLDNKTLMGVYDFLDQEHITENKDELGNVVKQLLTPKYDKESRILYSLPSYMKKVVLSSDDDMTLEEKARQLLEQKIDQEDQMKELGNLFHGLLYRMIKGNGPFKYNKEYQKYLELFESDKFKDVLTKNSIDPNIKNSVNQLMTEIWNYFNKAYIANGGAILAEIEVKTNEPKINGSNGLIGRLDILGITKEGHVNIYDLKLSTDLFNNWDSAKILRNDYQLGVYRQLLAANGIKVDSSSLKLLPIAMSFGNINSLQLDNIENRTGGTISSQPSGLNYEGGKISETLKRLIPAPITRDSITESDLGFKINEDIKSMLGKFETKSKNIPQEEYLFEKYKNSSVNGEYQFIDELTGKMIKVKSEEELRKSIKNYVERSINAKNSKIIELKTGLIDSINSKKIPDNLLKTKQSNWVNSNKILTLNFEKYTKDSSNWRVIDIDELTNIGVIGLENVKSGVVEFISITSENLSNLHNIGLGTTILGKFMTDREAYKYDIDIMPALVKHLETIKIFSVLNNMPEIFKNRKLGSIKIINYLSGEAEIVNYTNALENFNLLAGKAKLINNFSNNVIKPIDMFDYIKHEIDAILLESNDKGLKLLIDGSLNTIVGDNKIMLLLKIQQLLKDNYPTILKGKSRTEKLNFNSEVDKVNALISWGVSYYAGLDFTSEAKLSKWGFNFGEIFSFLQSPFSYNIRRTSKQGYKISGIGQGLYMSTSASTPSDNLRRVFNYMSSSILKLREEYNKQQKTISDATKKFLDDNDKSTINRLIIGNNYDLYDDLFVYTDDGKLAKNLSVKNPFDSKSGLNSSQIEYLRLILWEINKFKIPKLTLEQRQMSFKEGEKLEETKKYINSGEYFEIPLKRASEFQRLKDFNNVGVKQYFNKKWEELKDTVDQRMVTDEEVQYMESSSQNNTVMSNHHNINRNIRQNILDKHNVYDFERNLDLVALDTIFMYTKETIMNDLLPIIDSFSIMVRYRSEMTGEDFNDILQTLDDQVTITIFNKPLIPEELQDAAKIISTVRSATSTLHIAARPLLWLKEITVGQLQNVNRAWVEVYGESSNEFSYKSLMKANSIIYGAGINKYGDVFQGNSDIADFTLVQALNNVYGIANMDINQIVDKTKTDRFGLAAGLSKWMYWANTAPDFMNRMTLFLAKMVQDDCFDAHTLDKNGNLVYDFSKDNRFSEFFKHKDNPNYTSDLFLKQKALYRTMLEEFKSEGYKNSKGEFLKFGDDLPRAYTTKQQLSIKEFSDTTYGFYDQEAKSLKDQQFIGLVYTQFMTFWTAKLKLWAKAPGKQTSQGSFKQMLDKDTGKPLYRKIEEDPNGNISVIFTVDNDGSLEPAMQWEGDYLEGLYYSLVYTIRDLATFKFDDIWKNKYRLHNTKLAMMDILIGIILYNLIKMIFTNGTGKEKDVDNDILIPYRVITKAFAEFNPITSIGGMSWEPAFYKTFVNLKNDGIRTLTGDQELSDFINSNVSMLHDFDLNE